MGPAALGWRDGRLSWDAAAATRARLVATVAQDADGTAFDAALLDALPAGTIDRLVYAADVAGGYRPPPALPANDNRSLAQCYAQCCTWLGGLLPQQPNSALCVHAYDFATLAAAEAAATVSLAGTELRVEVLAWPLVIAAAVRAGEGHDAPPLLDAEAARRLPFGAARAIVEAADVLSELGGPDPGVRFLDASGAGLDGRMSVAAAADGSVPE